MANKLKQPSFKVKRNNDLKISLSSEEFRLSFGRRLSMAKDLDEIADGVIGVLQNLHESGVKRIGFVCGKVSADDPDLLRNNTDTLDKYTRAVRQEVSFPVFSCIDVFPTKLYWEMEKESKEKWKELWRKVFRSGYLTDIFMTDKWTTSEGALDEYDTAKRLKMNIRYVEKDPKLDKIIIRSTFKSDKISIIK